MMSTKSPSIFNMMNFSFGVSVLRYDTGTSKMAMYLPSNESIMRLVNRDYKYMIGEDASSLGM